MQIFEQYATSVPRLVANESHWLEASENCVQGESMNIVVTGAAGFIGSHLAEGLVQAGHQVIGIDNFNDYYAPLIKHHNVQQIRSTGVEFLELDLATDDLGRYLPSIDVVYHCAAQPGISSKTGFQAYIRNNLTATENLLQSLIDNTSLRLFVNIATSSIYGAMAVAAEDVPPEPISYYGVTKLAAEQLVMSYHRQQKIPATSFRLFSVYGARERPDKLYPRLIHSIADGVPFPLFANSLSHKRSYTFVGDVVKALIKALDHNACIGEIINLGTPDSISTGQAIQVVEQIMGKKAHYEERAARPGDQRETVAVIDKAEKILGYTPNTIFTDGIQSEIAWFETLPMNLRSSYSAIG